MSSETVEWAVELTWPDGRVEIHERSTAQSASTMAEWHERGPSRCSARVMVRVVTVSEWEHCPVVAS